MSQSKSPTETGVPEPTRSEADEVARAVPVPVEVGGRDGPDPTRYGDWEKNGRCIDF